MSQIEIEKRFKNFDYQQLRELFDTYNIVEDGGELFKVSSFYSTKRNQIIRTRNEGNKITFTIKKKVGEYDREWEVTVDNQDTIDEMLLELGIRRKYSLEKFREKYKYGNSELVFDYYPGLPPYLEIESKTETELFDLMKKLNLTEERFGVKDLYLEQYGITKDRKENDLLFSNVIEIMSPFITKNKDVFIRLVEHQKEFIANYRNRLK